MTSAQSKMKNLTRTGLCIVLGTFLGSTLLFSQVPINGPHTRGVLYLGEGEHQPLVVGFGGAEGGNAWTGKRMKKVRDQFLEQGYAFLALAYFGGEGMPDSLDRVPLENIHAAILQAAENPKVDRKKIALVGVSIGAQLALLLASHYPDITCVVGIVPSHVVFPGHTYRFSTSCWSFEGNEVPFVPLTRKAIEYTKREEDYRRAFETVLEDSVAEQKALIQVERINGPIFLLSAVRDEVWPSTPMSEKIVARLRTKSFSHTIEHLPVDGGHTAPLKEFDKIFAFLGTQFRSRSQE